MGDHQSLLYRMGTVLNKKTEEAVGCAIYTRDGHVVRRDVTEKKNDYYCARVLCEFNVFYMMWHSLIVGACGNKFLHLSHQRIPNLLSRFGFMAIQREIRVVTSIGMCSFDCPKEVCLIILGEISFI